MVQSVNIKALTTLVSVVRRPYLAAPHVFVPTVSGECTLAVMFPIDHLEWEITIADSSNGVRGSTSLIATTPGSTDTIT